MSYKMKINLWTIKIHYTCNTIMVFADFFSLHNEQQTVIFAVYNM